MDQMMIERLKKIPEIVDVIFDEQWPWIVGEINPAIFNGNYHTSIVKCNLYFLNLPYIKDTFGSNHSERRRWRQTLEPDLREPLKENALRLGNMDIVSVTMRQLKEQYIGTNPELVQESRDKTYASICWRDEYLTLSTDEATSQIDF
ncbi:MAG: hypothetical protein AABX11_03030 [Nanoarchaeota archaeon]